MSELTGLIPVRLALGPGSISDRAKRYLAFVASLAMSGCCIWSALAWWVGKPPFLPSPLATLRGAGELIENGELFASVAVSFSRVLIGFTIGTCIGIPLGLFMGRSEIVRSFVDPYVEFFRFIPPIAFVTLAVIWFGLGETSKIILIVYTTVFMVAINTMIGVLSIDPDKRFAALSSGRLTPGLFYVTIPAVIPNIVAGMKIGIGGALSFGMYFARSVFSDAYFCWPARLWKSAGSATSSYSSSVPS